MPISAAQIKRYPGGSIRSPEWLALRSEILSRADNRCEGTPQFPDCEAVNGELHPITGSKVVLTIAHMDQDPSHNEHSNLRALCQKCHNAWDAPHRRANAGVTRHAKRGQPDFFGREIC